MTDITFSFPWILLLFPVCLGITVWLGLRAPGHTAFTRGCTIALRGIGVALLILSMAGTGISRRADVTGHVFAIDMSDSTCGIEAALAAIREAEAFRTDKDAVGVIAFGGSAVIESVPDAGNEIGAIRSFVDTEYTNIASALSLAQSAFPEGMKRRVVLVSDGLENADNALAAARALREANIVVDVLPVQAAVFDEVQLVGLTVPQRLNKNMEYEIEAELYSTAPNAAVIYIYKNNTLVAEAEVSVRTGANRFVFTDTADAGGGTIYRAEIRPLRDVYAQNNRAYAYGYVEDVPRVLLVDYDGAGAEAARILAASQVQVTQVHAVAAPATVDRLNVYDSVILADVPLDALPAGFDAALESYARNTGGGVLAIGGENSYALGGYYQTGLETLLPVEMRLKDMQEVPNLGMVIVLDRSGSMTSGSFGVSKLDLAKEAVIRAVESLNPRDTFGVLTFDDAFEWAVPFSVVGGSASAIQARIAQISPGGGTSILPALTEAVQVLEAADTKLKHIVLLTDGQAEQSGYEGVLRVMQTQGITLSSIAVGSDSDWRLLERLADEGGGRYYYTDEFTDLPQIFTKETTLAGKVYLNNRSFYPKIGTLSPILTGLDGLSPLDGYISATAKPRADVVLLSDTDEPVLATWQFGLGRTAAWTTDASGRWTAGWLASGEGETLLRNTVAWTLRRQGGGDVSLALQMNGKDSAFVLTTPVESGVSAVAGTLTATDGTEYPLTMRATAPGEFRAEVKDIAPGAYVAGLTLVTPDGEEQVSLGTAVSYSAEYDMRRMERGAALLAKIVETTGGQMLDTAAEIYREVEEVSLTGTVIAQELLLAALVLFLIDVALRRFPRVWQALERWTGKRLSRFDAVRARAVSAAGMLLSEKENPARSGLDQAKQTAAKAVDENKKKAPAMKDKVGAKPAEGAADTGNTSNVLLARKKKREGR